MRGGLEWVCKVRGLLLEGVPRGGGGGEGGRPAWAHMEFHLPAGP